jgi:hypothetical protein
MRDQQIRQGLVVKVPPVKDRRAKQTIKPTPEPVPLQKTLSALILRWVGLGMTNLRKMMMRERREKRS